MPMLTAEQVARRVARELDAGGTRCAPDALPTNLRLVLERDFGDAQLIAHSVPTTLHLISALGVIEVSDATWILREVPPGISAADVQARVSVPLLCAPTLAEINLD